jgi:hypothetical protein
MHNLYRYATDRDRKKHKRSRRSSSSSSSSRSRRHKSRKHKSVGMDGWHFTSFEQSKRRFDFAGQYGPYSHQSDTPESE